MYRITCNGFTLYDPRDDELIVLNPHCKLAANTVGEGSFTILANHPNYGQLKKLKSIFEIQQDDVVIFRGRMTNNSQDMYNQLDVDLEGVLGFTNDTIIDPFKFPDDFPNAKKSTNVVEYFLRWILDQHNAHVESWQKLKVGRVTVRDPNNIITRSSDSYLSTWEVLKTKLFESALGGYLCMRYEPDGNCIDYLERFEETNPQKIIYSENLLDITNDTDANETYTAILPVGKDGLTLASLPDGNLNADLVKKGKYIYSKSAKPDCGWICVPPEESKWDDVTDVNNLKTKAMEYLSGTAMLFSNTITIKAVDLHFTDDQIQSFRIYQNISVHSPAHGVVDAKYPLTQLDIDIMNPQNTIITIGNTVRTLIDIDTANQANASAKVEQLAQQKNESDSAIHVQLEYIGKAMANVADHIVEVNMVDGWTYRKWSSGIAECWKSIPSADVADGVTYPVTFDGDPCVQTTEHDEKTHYFVIGKILKE